MSFKKIFNKNSWFYIYIIFVLLIFLVNKVFAFTGTPENMVLVNAGGFTRGIDKNQIIEIEKSKQNSPKKIAKVQLAAFEDETPAKMIYLPSYFIDKFEVSNEEYTNFILATDHPAPAYWDHNKLNKPNQPVTGVNWFDANTYCLWANKRLPTEAEWEKAARGPAGLIYPWGNNLDSTKANFAKGKSGEKHITDSIDSHPEGKSYYGAYNMAGNVFEWVHDWYDPNYYKTSSDIRNPQGPSLGMVSTNKILNKYEKLSDKKRVIRGGSWFAPAASITTTHRFWNNPMNNSYGVGLGFRCARDKAKESSLEARAYYMDALVQIGEDKYKSAHESIENAINISPNNEEYTSMKKLIENSLK